MTHQSPHTSPTYAPLLFWGSYIEFFKGKILKSGIIAHFQQNTCTSLYHFPLNVSSVASFCLVVKLLDVNARTKLSSSEIYLIYLFPLTHPTRPVGDSEAAARWHPSDQEGLSSPGRPIHCRGSQDGLSRNYHARLGEMQPFLNWKFESFLRKCYCRWFQREILWKLMHEYSDILGKQMNKCMNLWMFGPWAV